MKRSRLRETPTTICQKRPPEALALHLEDLLSQGGAIPEPQGIEVHLQSATDRPGPNDLIAFIPVREVAPGMVA